MSARRNHIRQIANVIWQSQQKFGSGDASAVADMISRSIIRAGLSTKMDLIKEEYERLRDAASGTVRVTMSSARELSKTAREEAELGVATILGATTLAAEWLVDPTLVGGLRVQTDHYEVRSSIADMLRQL